jgi:hypothetical protein
MGAARITKRAGGTGFAVSQIVRPVPVKTMQIRAANLAATLDAFAGGRCSKERWPLLETEMFAFVKALRGLIGWNNLMSVEKDDE